MFATLMAVGNSTDSVSARLPGMFAPAAIGWSARLVVWAVARVPWMRPSSARRPATATVLRAALGAKKENMLMVLACSVRLREGGLQEYLGVARRLADAHAQPVHRRAGRCDLGVAVVRPTGRSSA